MLRIDNITTAPKQEFTVNLQDKTQLGVILEYKPNQAGWFVTLTYKDQTIPNMRVVNMANMIRELKNVWGVGLRCDVSDGGEPYFIDDFQTGRAQLSILNADEVESLENRLYVKV